jgi:hypothetical protein
MGFPYEALVGGGYKLLLESVLYLYYDGFNYAFPHGSYDFSDPGIPEAYRHEMPWMPLEVTFTDGSGAVLGGGPYLLHIGAYGSGRAFVKWRTPASPAAGTISVSVRRQDGGTFGLDGISSADIRYEVVELERSNPPDPEAADRFDGFANPAGSYGGNYAGSATATWTANSRGGWSSGGMVCFSVDIWEGDPQPAYFGLPSFRVERLLSPVADIEVSPYVPAAPGRPEQPAVYRHQYRYRVFFDDGHWDINQTAYTATLNPSLAIAPDEKAPAEAGAGAMRSGYGINAEASASVTGNGRAWCTGIQNVQAFFPEFNYSDGWGGGAPSYLAGPHWRWLAPKPDGGFEFAANPWSTSGRPVHFTPIWFPDTAAYAPAYTVWADMTDAWTPGGELKASASASIRIDGSVYDDWHVAPGWR